jgi:hypothetical protein
MAEDLIKLNVKARRTGIFNGYRLLGIKYQFPDGHTAWAFESWEIDGDLFKAYWVEDEEFHQVAIHSYYQMTSRTLVQKFAKVEHIKDAEKQAMLEAITDWTVTRG